MIDKALIDAEVAARTHELRVEIAQLKDENRELLARCECYRVEVYILRQKVERFETLAGKELI